MFFTKIFWVWCSNFSFQFQILHKKLKTAMKKQKKTHPHSKHASLILSPPIDFLIGPKDQNNL